MFENSNKVYCFFPEENPFRNGTKEIASFKLGGWVARKRKIHFCFFLEQDLVPVPASVWYMDSIKCCKSHLGDCIIVFQNSMSPNGEIRIADLHAVWMLSYTSPKSLFSLAYVIGTALALHKVYHPTGLAIYEVRGLKGLPIWKAKYLFFPY